jgi:hypothetical protein
LPLLVFLEQGTNSIPPNDRMRISHDFKLIKLSPTSCPFGFGFDIGRPGKRSSNRIGMGSEEGGQIAAKLD